MAGTSTVTTVLSTRVANSMYEQIQVLASKEDREVSDLVRVLLREALEARAKKNGRRK